MGALDALAREFHARVRGPRNARFAFLGAYRRTEIFGHRLTTVLRMKDLRTSCRQADNRKQV